MWSNEEWTFLKKDVFEESFQNNKPYLFTLKSGSHM